MGLNMGGVASSDADFGEATLDKGKKGKMGK